MKKMIFLGIISGIIIGFCSFPVLAATINVPADYATIQSGIDAAGSGDTVQVSSGTYVENITMKWGVTVEGAGAEVTTIDGGGKGPVIYMSSNSKIKGFSIINGFTGEYTGNTSEVAGIYCVSSGVSIRDNIIHTGSYYGIDFSGQSNTSSAINNVIYGHRRYGLSIGFDSPLIENNVIYNNSWRGISTWNSISNPIIRNNTIVKNQIGISYHNFSTPIIENNIIVNNTHIGISGSSTSGEVVCNYNDVYGNETNYDEVTLGVGEISVNPLFVNSAGNDYHLQTGSLCIDAGNPLAQYNDPDGTRNDMGAYGGPNSEDIFPPETIGHTPAKSATAVAVDTNIVVHIKDPGLGVDIDSLVMTVEGAIVVPSVTGMSVEYVLTYDPPVDFNMEQEVNVTIDAADLAEPFNVMTQEVYSFTIIGAEDTIAPTATITSHTNDQIVSSSPITVSGTASDANESTIVSVEVNGIEATTTDGYSTWSAGGLSLVEGNNSVVVATEDEYFNRDSSAVNINVILDTTPPNTLNHSPAKNSIENIQDTNILVTVKDNFAGVDLSSVIITVEETTVYDGSNPGAYPDVTVVEPPYSGNDTDYMFTYDSSVDFSYGQVVNVTIDCQDIVGNVMTQDSYYFTIRNSGRVINVPADYATIQGAIDVSYTGDFIYVSAGIYEENIVLKKGVNVKGERTTTTKIIGNFGSYVITGADNCVIEGFTIKGERGQTYIYCNYASTVIRNNLLIASEGYYGVLVSLSSSPEIINNTIIGFKYGIAVGNGSSSIIKNNIIVDCLDEGIAIYGSSSISYNNLYNNTVNYKGCSAGTEDISADPLFFNPPGEDYRLGAGSPCIDAGDPDTQYNDSDGTRNDMGAYGGIGVMTEDVFPPIVTGHNPARNATEVPIDTNIIVSVGDNEAGVNIDSIVMTVEGITIVPSITGTPAEYVLSYNPLVDFSYGQKINVTIDACDLADPVNVMPQHAYSFIIEQSEITFTEDLSQVKAYPNPYKGNSFSGIIFNFLTEGSKIKIYTLSGQLVKEIDVGAEGRVFWDVKNEDGKEIASGIYIYVIVDEKGNKKSGKIAIIK